MTIKPFRPAGLGSLLVANAVSASAPIALDEAADQYVFTNTSATAIAYVEIAPGAAGRNAVVPTASVKGSVPVLPNMQFVLTVGLGPKKLSVIASAADGNLIFSAGNGI